MEQTEGSITKITMLLEAATGIGLAHALNAIEEQFAESLGLDVTKPVGDVFARNVRARFYDIVVDYYFQLTKTTTDPDVAKDIKAAHGTKPAPEKEEDGTFVQFPADPNDDPFITFPADDLGAVRSITVTKEYQRPAEKDDDTEPFAEKMRHTFDKQFNEGCLQGETDYYWGDDTRIDLTQYKLHRLDGNCATFVEGYHDHEKRMTVFFTNFTVGYELAECRLDQFIKAVKAGGGDVFFPVMDDVGLKANPAEEPAGRIVTIGGDKPSADVIDKIEAMREHEGIGGDNDGEAILGAFPCIANQLPALLIPVNDLDEVGHCPRCYKMIMIIGSISQNTIVICPHCERNFTVKRATNAEPHGVMPVVKVPEHTNPTITCPHCKARSVIGPGIKTGRRLVCDHCQTPFIVDRKRDDKSDPAVIRAALIAVADNNMGVNKHCFYCRADVPGRTDPLYLDDLVKVVNEALWPGESPDGLPEAPLTLTHDTAACDCPYCETHLAFPLTDDYEAMNPVTCWECNRMFVVVAQEKDIAARFNLPPIYSGPASDDVKQPTFPSLPNAAPKYVEPDLIEFPCPYCKLTNRIRGPYENPVTCDQCRGSFNVVVTSNADVVVLPSSSDERPMKEVTIDGPQNNARKIAADCECPHCEDTITVPVRVGQTTNMCCPKCDGRFIVHRAIPEGVVLIHRVPVTQKVDGVPCPHCHVRGQHPFERNLTSRTTCCREDNCGKSFLMVKTEDCDD
jgi:transposase-like protein